MGPRRVAAQIRETLVSGYEPARFCLNMPPKGVISGPSPSLLQHRSGVMSASVQHVGYLPRQILIYFQTGAH